MLSYNSSSMNKASTVTDGGPRTEVPGKVCEGAVGTLADGWLALPSVPTDFAVTSPLSSLSPLNREPRRAGARLEVNVGSCGLALET